MRKSLLTTAIIANILALGVTVGHADPVRNPATGAWQAPVGHLQPRSQAVLPSGPVEQAEQQQLSAYDVQQQKLDEQLDRRLNICRGC